MYSRMLKLHLNIVIFVALFFTWHITRADTQFSVTERTYKKLETVERLIQQKKEKEALNILEKLESSTKNKSYELTLVYQAFGYIYYNSNRLDKALDYFEKCLALNSAPVTALQNIRRNLMQIYSQTNNYNKAIDHFTIWLKKEASPSADILALGGILYAYIKDYEAAIQYLQKAIKTANPAKESWYNALLSIYYEKNDLHSAIALLNQLTILYSGNSEYWKQLFNAYYLNNNLERALSTLQLAYTNQLLNNKEDIITLAKLNIYLGCPINSVKLINNELKSGLLKHDETTLELLATAYLQSQETEQAALVYAQLARLTHDPKRSLFAARLFLEAKDWNNVIEVLEDTVPNLDNGQAHLLKGMAFMSLNQEDHAMREFTIAKQDTDTYTNAIQWIEYLNQIKYIR